MTIQALASVLGGTQSLHTNSYDEALGLPTESSATVALRTQQIIAEESGVADAVDPMAGSWHVEELTKAIYDASHQLIEEIESKGGALAAIEDGWQQQEIHLSAYKYLNEIERNERNIVGVNYGMMDEKEDIPILKTDATLGERQSARLHELRKNRNAESVAQSLDAIRNAAEDGTNLFPVVLDAVRHRATLGEIMNAMKDEFGTYMAPSGF